MSTSRTVEKPSQVKSGVNWCNSSQQATFSKAASILRQGNCNLHVRCIEEYAYGRSEIRELSTHYGITCNDFWEIPGWDGTVRAVMELLGRHAGNRLT